MSFFTILDTLLLGPLKLFFEVVFSLANSALENPGLSIIALSLAMNFLVLPLYMRADAMQEQARETEARLRAGIAHIKKTFSGDERMMILQTYYRQNHYSPISGLKGSVSLLLEIPFFMAAYQFLSSLSLLEEVPFGPIRDLSLPDGLIVIGGLTINLLPILMTLINFISSALYLKGHSLKTKIQLYAMACFFLVFLYTSPSGLVFYWTLNNLFSLIKTIFYKLPNPQRILRILAAILGVFTVTGALVLYTDHTRFRVYVFVVGLALFIPILLPILRKLKEKRFPQKEKKLQANQKRFVMATLFITLLMGVLIPSDYIASSPQEFLFLKYFYHPLYYVVHALLLAGGTFLVWMRVFYWLASEKGKVIMERLIFAFCGVFLVDYLYFGTDLGVISNTLRYENGLSFSPSEQTLNLLVVAVLAVLLYFVAYQWKRLTAGILTVAVISITCMSGINVMKIKKSIDLVNVDDINGDTNKLNFTLSKNGKNVFVLMLDRAMGEYIPYLIKEKPELKEMFDGFTYYPNTISFGSCTNYCTPSLMGGYEYTPVELNKRDDQTLMEKQNEANLMLPRLFADNDYQVRVFDPVYTNYQWIPDLSVFDPYPDIQAVITKGRFISLKDKKQVTQNNNRNFYFFSLMKSLPLCIQPTLYNDGYYRRIAKTGDATGYSAQMLLDPSRAIHISSNFMEGFSTLENLKTMTEVKEDDINTYVFMSNDATHEPSLMQTPDYLPAHKVDNTQYDLAHTDRFTVDGKTLRVEENLQMTHYSTNMASLLQVGKWLNYLREQNVYDNTRIIIVSDHGRDLAQLEDLKVENRKSLSSVEGYYPLLLVKDFGAAGFTVDQEFMTIADVPTLATRGLIEEPRNPFTGNLINSDEKTAHDQMVAITNAWDVTENDGNTFIPSYWASVKKDLRDMNNWNFYWKKTVLTQHQLP